MTQYYYFIRREVYELKKANKIYKCRSVGEMFRLFTPLNWFLFALSMLSIIAMIIIACFSLGSANMIFLELIPFLVLGLSLLLFDFVSERRLYKKKEREREIQNEKERLIKYMADVQSVFDKYELDDNSIALIKKECEDRVNKTRAENSSLIKRIFDIIIIAPFAAVLAILIDADKQVNINAIIIILFFGFLSWILAKAMIPLKDIWNNTHKDQCLLDALNDFEYISHKNKQ